MEVRYSAANASGAAPLTVNVAGLGVKDITATWGGLAYSTAAGEIQANDPIRLIFDGTRFVLMPEQTISSGIASNVFPPSMNRFLTLSNVVEGDTWTPVDTANSNLDDLVPGEFTYIRIKDTVSFAGLAVIDVTSSGAFSFELDLPVASNFANASNANGLVNSDGGNQAVITASVANDTLVITGTAGVTTTNTIHFVGQYKILL